MRAECRTTKTLGEPDAGNPQVRFDEGALETGLRSGLNGHEAGNGGYSQDLAYGIPRQRPTPPLSANLDHGLLRLALNAPAACDPPQRRPRSIPRSNSRFPGTQHYFENQGAKRSGR